CHIIPETFPTTASTTANTPEFMCVLVFLFRPLSASVHSLLLCLAIRTASACHIPHQHMVSHSILFGIYMRCMHPCPSSAFWKRTHMHRHTSGGWRLLRFDDNSFGVKIDMEPAVMPHLFDFPPTCCYTPILKSVCGTDYKLSMLGTTVSYGVCTTAVLAARLLKRHAQRQPVMSKSKDLH
ncbi:unnamed protein product, partial [Ectocarpus sp. 4 AP-2014]